MRLGYCCINKTLDEYGKFKTITVKSASKLSQETLDNKLKSIAIDNLYNTYKILQWNIENNINIYRMTSDMIPLATHELNTWLWWEDIDVLNWCNKIKQLVQKHDLRISMHPDQYTVVNSINPEVVVNSIVNLEYHNKLSNLLGNNTLILHVGGVSGNKESAIQRFINNFKLLNRDIQNKIVLENDDKSFNAEDVLSICQQINIPMVLDVHHDRCLPSSKPIKSLIDAIKNTWNGNIPKCHLSSGRESINDRSHADYISIEDYKYTLELTEGKFDIMLEAKCKDLALIKIKEVSV